MTTTDARKRLAEKMEQRKAFAAGLAEDHLPGVSERTTEAVFEFAWREGHASGEHEVEAIYIELAEIIDIAREEAR